MTSIAPHITAFLRERLPLQRGASPHTCESYAYTFKLLFEFASNQHKVTPSKLYLEQIDAVLVMDFLAHIEATRDNGPVPGMPGWQLSSPSCASSSIACPLSLNKVCAFLRFRQRRSICH